MPPVLLNSLRSSTVQLLVLWLAGSLAFQAGCTGITPQPSQDLAIPGRDHAITPLDDAAAPPSCEGSGCAGSCSPAPLVVLDAQPNLPVSASLALDRSGVVHIAYIDLAHHSLRYLTNRSGSWDNSEVTQLEAYSSSCSMGVDSRGSVHIAFHDRSIKHGVLRIASNTSGDWNVRQVDGDPATDTYVGASPDLALDAADKVHICYANGIDVSIKYATNASGTWQAQTITEGLPLAFAVEAAGHAHLLYWEGAAPWLRYAHRAAGSWETQTIDTQASNPFAAIALDARGGVHLAYSAAPVPGLKYLTSSAGGWTTTSIDPHGTGIHSRWLSLDSLDAAHLLYADESHVGLKHATSRSDSWVVTDIEGIDGGGESRTLAVDRSGRVHILANDYGNQHLYYLAICP